MLTFSDGAEFVSFFLSSFLLRHMRALIVFIGFIHIYKTLPSTNYSAIFSVIGLYAALRLIAIQKTNKDWAHFVIVRVQFIK